MSLKDELSNIADEVNAVQQPESPEELHSEDKVADFKAFIMYHCYKSAKEGKYNVSINIDDEQVFRLSSRDRNFESVLKTTDHMMLKADYEKLVEELPDYFDVHFTSEHRPESNSARFTLDWSDPVELEPAVDTEVSVSE